MKLVRKIIQALLILLTGFLAVTGFLGGIGLLAHLNTPPLEMLQGSPFKDYTIPGLSLFMIVGGSALLATWLLVRRSRFALLSATLAGIIIMFFEFVEMLVIGSPVGVARALQVLYVGLGTAIAGVSIGIGFLDLLDNP